MKEQTPDVVVLRVIAATPERIWNALTDAREIEKWFFTRTEAIDAKLNGSYRIHWESNVEPELNHARWGNYVEFDPPRKLVFEWMGVGPMKNPEWNAFDPSDEIGTLVSITLTPVEGGTLVKLVHSGWGSSEAWKSSRDGHNKGWTYYLENLDSVLNLGIDLRVGGKQKINA